MIGDVRAKVKRFPGSIEATKLFTDDLARCCTGLSIFYYWVDFAFKYVCPFGNMLRYGVEVTLNQMPAKN